MRPASFFIAFLLLGVFLLRLIFLPIVEKSLPDGQKITFKGRLSSSPQVKGSTQILFLRPKGYESVYVTIPASPRLYYGERVSITGTLKKKVLDDERTVNSIYFPTLVVEKDQGIGFRLRQHVISVYERYLPLDLARLLLGITFGIKEPLSEAFSDQIRLVGLLHVIAASGMNITLLAGGLVAALGRVVSRKMTIGITLVAIFGYASFAGFEPSIVRAGIMGSLALLAGLLGRQYFAFWALFLTGYSMLLFEPLLLFDVGFQLSFLATLGIMFLKPLLEFSVPKVLDAFKEDFTTSLSAQIATAPILLATFGQISLISLLINALILWTIPPLMVLGGIAALLSFVFAPLAAVLLYICLPILLLFQLAVSVFSTVPFTLQTDTLPPFLVTLYYIFLLTLIGIMRRKKQKKAHE